MIIACDFEGTRVKEFNGHKDKPTEVVFVQQDDRMLLMTSSKDGTIRVFDFETEECLYVFFNHRAQQMGCMALHHSQKFVVAGNKNCLLYLLKTTR